MFGNETGGGTLSSKTDYNPTPYVAVAYAAIDVDDSYEVAMIFLPVYIADKRYA